MLRSYSPKILEENSVGGCERATELRARGVEPGSQGECDSTNIVFLCL